MNDETSGRGGLQATTRSKWLAGLAACAAIAFYYALFYFPPRLVAVNDPDRFYHLGLAELTAQQGLLRTLPQVEDLGWGSYFPDKEFLFHVFTGLAHWLGGAEVVLLLVPAIGVLLVAVLFMQLIRTVRPWQAFFIVVPVVMLTGHFLFRMSMLRPHILAVLFFGILLSAVLRRNRWVAALAAFCFALSYHAFYIVALVAGVAFIALREQGGMRRQLGFAILVGLALGILINPYFPSNLVMSWWHVQIALGIDLPADLESGAELLPYDFEAILLTYGIAPICVSAAICIAWYRRLWPVSEHREFWFLLVLVLLLTALGMKGRRAMEYAIPSAILLAGYTVRWLDWKGSLPTLAAALLASQGYYTWVFYQESWTQPRYGNVGPYFNAIAAIPDQPARPKVFNCDWGGSPYLLYFRPDLRFVDILDPVFLWKVSPRLYILRQGLMFGRVERPAAVLRSAFRADYVLCDEPPLNQQMRDDPGNFERIPIGGNAGNLQLYRLRPESLSD